MRSKIFRIFLVVVDVILVNLGIILSFLMRFRGFPARNFLAYGQLFPAFTLVFLLNFYFFGLYEKRQTALFVLLASFKAIILATLINMGLAYVFRVKAGAFPTTIFLLSALMIIILFNLWRALLSIKTPSAKVLVLGNVREVKGIIRRLRMEHHYEEIFEFKEELKRLPSFIRDRQIEEVIIANDRDAFGYIRQVIPQCKGLNIKFKLVPGLYETYLRSTRSVEIDGLPLVELEAEPIARWTWVLKRILDLIVTILILAIVSPLILLISLLIWIDSPGFILYRQKRIGRDGKSFILYKFRTMHPDAEKETGPVLASPADERITRVGRFLRKSRLDELPQLFNILKGEMSLVGPRPERPYFVDAFKEEIPGYTQRFQVRPGLTGLAQVYARYDTSARNKLRFDLLYIRNYSLLLDLSIILRTIPVIIKQRGR